MNEILSPCLAFLIGMLIGKLIVSFCKRIIEHYRKNEQVPADNVPIFSTSKYLEEIEKVHLSILEEQENREPYIITLWWGLDGVRLNDAGEVEWISRREKPKVNYTYDGISNIVYFHHPWLTYPTVQWNSMTQSIDSGIQQMTGDINSSIQSQIDSIQRLQCQATQMEQNARLYESLSIGRDINGRIIRR